MKRNVNAVIAAAFTLVLTVCLVVAGPVAAQQNAGQPAALPTAAGADRTSEGGLSSAPASIPSAPGTSPLEPYLVTWLLPVSGIFAVLMAIYADRRLRQGHPRL